MHTHAASPGCAGTYTSSGTAATSGGAHPTCGQTFPGEHQRNLQRGFKRPATANTNTHARNNARTHQTAQGKRPDQMERREQRASLPFFSFFFLCGSTLKVAQHLRSPPPGAGVDFHRRWSFVHTSLCVSVSRQGSSWPPGGAESGAEWSPPTVSLRRG